MSSVIFSTTVHKCNMHTIFIKHYLWMPCHHNYCYSSRLSAVFILPPQYSSTNFSFLKFSHFCCQVALFQSYKIYNISCIIVFKHRFSEKALYVLFVGFFARYVSSFSANHQLLAKTFKLESSQKKIFFLSGSMYLVEYLNFK